MVIQNRKYGTQTPDVNIPPTVNVPQMDELGLNILISDTMEALTGVQRILPKQQERFWKNKSSKILTKLHTLFKKQKSSEIVKTRIECQILEETNQRYMKEKLSKETNS